MKSSFLIFILFTSVAHAGPGFSERVEMPAEYTFKETNDFVKSLNTVEIQKKVMQKYPDIGKYKGRFKYKAVSTTSATGQANGVGIITEITGMEGFEYKDELKSLLIKYLKENVEKLNKEP